MPAVLSTARLVASATSALSTVSALAPRQPPTWADLARHFLMTVYSSKRGKLLLSIWGATPLVWLFFVIRRSRQRAEERREQLAAMQSRSTLNLSALSASGGAAATTADGVSVSPSTAAAAATATSASNPTSSAAARPAGGLFAAQIKSLLRICLPSPLSRESVMVVAYTAILCSRVAITIKIANLVGELAALMGKRDFTRMFLQQVVFSLWCIPAAASNALMRFFEARIALAFRARLARYLHRRYLDGLTFYRVGTDATAAAVLQAATGGSGSKGLSRKKSYAALAAAAKASSKRRVEEVEEEEDDEDDEDDDVDSEGENSTNSDGAQSPQEEGEGGKGGKAKSKPAKAGKPAGLAGLAAAAAAASAASAAAAAAPAKKRSATSGDSGRLEQLDQLLTSDVDLFASSLTNLYGHALKPLLDVIFLTATLSQSIGTAQMVAFFGYFGAMNKLLAMAKPSFARLTVRSQELEGRYRSHHQRVCQYREEIAFVRGASRERDICDAAFAQLHCHEIDSLNTHLYVDFVDSYVLKYGGMMMSYCCMLPVAYLHSGGVSDYDATKNYLTSSTMLVSLGTAVKDLMSSYKESAKLRGLTGRVAGLLAVVDRHARRHALADAIALAAARGEDTTALEELDEEDDESEALRAAGYDGVIERGPGPAFAADAAAAADGAGGESTLPFDGIAFEGVDIYTPAPDNTLLVSDLTLRIAPGQHLLVTGVNGAGKSSLFRTMGGLWPLHRGRMRLPRQRDFFFISQNSYMCPGTLRDQITYPESRPFTGNATCRQLDARLLALLEQVELGGLLERYRWSDIEPWQSVLSGGERQRLCIARLMYHRPRFAILDECTSAISVEMQDRVFELCKAAGITMLTIAHTPTLRKHHIFELEYTPGVAPGWKLRRI